MAEKMDSLLLEIIEAEKKQGKSGEKKTQNINIWVQVNGPAGERYREIALRMGRAGRREEFRATLKEVAEKAVVESIEKAHRALFPSLPPVEKPAKK